MSDFEFDYSRYERVRDGVVCGRGCGRTVASLYNMIIDLINRDHYEADVYMIVEDMNECRYLIDKIKGIVLHLGSVRHVRCVDYGEKITQARHRFMIDRTLLKPNEPYIHLDFRFKVVHSDLMEKMRGVSLPLTLWYDDEYVPLVTYRPELDKQIEGIVQLRNRRLMR